MGLKDLRLTLYDVMGYFPPGIVLLLAVTAAVLALTSDVCFVDLEFLSSWKVVLALLFVAYVLGHIAQVFAEPFRFRPERYLFKTRWNDKDGWTHHAPGRIMRPVRWVWWRVRRRVLLFAGVSPLSPATLNSLDRALRDFYGDRTLTHKVPDAYRLCDAVLSVMEGQEDCEIF